HRPARRPWRCDHQSAPSRPISPLDLDGRRRRIHWAGPCGCAVRDRRSHVRPDGFGYRDTQGTAMRFAALLAFAAIAQAGELEIRGTVLDATTNQPIHRARVALSFWKEAGFIHRGALTIFTGEDGTFSFTDVPEGEFELLAFKTGFI